jgi:hypothetical protein
MEVTNFLELNPTREAASCEVRLEGLGALKKKSPTASGIEPGTFRLLA